MNSYIKSVSVHLPSDIVLLKASDSVKCPVDNNNFLMRGWSSRKESDVYNSSWSNYAMVTGEASGIWVFDVDNKGSNIDETLEWFYENNFDPEEDAFTVRTPSGGYHIYFIYEPNIQFKRQYLLHNDIQNNGQCVIFIGSKYPKGTYELINDHPITHAPDFIINAIRSDNISLKTLSVSSNNSDKSEDILDESDDEFKNNKKAKIVSYINLLPSNYYEDYNDWIKILMILYNELGYDDCLEIANTFSSKSNKYTENEVKHKIDSFKNNPDKSLKIGSLKKYVRESSNCINSNNSINNDDDSTVSTIDNDKMTMYDIEKYLHNRNYNSYEKAMTDIKTKMGKSICVFNAGTKRYIAVYTTYNEENDTKITDVGKYASFVETYRHIKIYYDDLIINKNTGKQTYITLEKKLTSVIESDTSFLYEKYYIKPYHPFEDNKSPNKRFKNLFSPMIATYLKTYDITKITPILFHIKKVIADNDEYNYKWIMSWLHQIIKTPWRKTDKCIVLNGSQGSGKSIVFDFMKKHIFGDITAYYASGMSALIDKFNWWMLSNIFIICDEPTKLSELNISTYEEKLKTVITAPMREVEKKGGDKMQAANYSNLIITSNHTKGIIVRNEDRRYAIFKVNNEYINNIRYFTTLTACLDNKEIMNIFFSYLYDYDDVVSISNIPETDIRKSCKEESHTQLEQFLFDSDFSVKFKKDEDLTNDILYMKYINWYSSMNANEKFKKSKIGFCKEMNKLYGKSIQRKIDKINTKIFVFNDDVIDRIKFLDETEDYSNNLITELNC